MRVIVLGTGRCGSVTLARACEFISNFTSGHETNYGNICVPDIPDKHIEIDPHLQWILPLLIRKYPPSALNVYAHLSRERPQTVASLVKRKGLECYCRFAFGAVLDPLPTAELFYDNTKALINSLVPNALPISINEPLEGAELFWKKIGAVGDYAAFMHTFEHVFNKGI